MERDRLLQSSPWNRQFNEYRSATSTLICHVKWFYSLEASRRIRRPCLANGPSEPGPGFSVHASRASQRAPSTTLILDLRTCASRGLGHGSPSYQNSAPPVSRKQQEFVRPLPGVTGLYHDHDLGFRPRRHAVCFQECIFIDTTLFSFLPDAFKHADTMGAIDIAVRIPARVFSNCKLRIDHKRRIRKGAAS